MDNKEEESDDIGLNTNFMALLKAEVSPEMDKLKMYRLEQDNLRQNIGCLSFILNMHVNKEGYNTPFYAVDDEIDRGLIRKKLLELVGRL